MKKIFHLQKENKNTDRLIESIKHETRKYLKRERKKTLPDKAIFWDFDCRFGQNSDEAQSLSASEIIALLGKAKDDKWDQCYVEIIARASFKARAKADANEDDPGEAIDSSEEE